MNTCLPTLDENMKNEKCEICGCVLNHSPQIDTWTGKLENPKVCSNACYDIWMRSHEIKAAIERGKKACLEHGFNFIDIYENRIYQNILDGWGRFIISPVYVSSHGYHHIGFVRKDGTSELHI